MKRFLKSFFIASLLILSITLPVYSADYIPEDAVDIGIDDAGDYYTGTDVEDALQEIGAGTTLDDRYVERAGDTVYGELELTYNNLKFTPVTAPGACTPALAGAAGNVTNGNHYYAITFVSAIGETELGTTSAVVDVDDKTINGQISLTAIPTGDVDNTNITSRKIYRTKSGNATAFYLLTTLADNVTTTYTDNTADADLGQVATYRDNTTFWIYRGDQKAGFLGTDSTAWGQNALDSITYGFSCTAIGEDALTANTLGTFNMALGNNSLESNTTASRGVAMGMNALQRNTIGPQNTGVGYGAGWYNIEGQDNTLVGQAAGEGTPNNSFSFTTCIGSYSGDHITTGSKHVLIGCKAGDNITSADGCIIIGYDLNSTDATTDDWLNIGGVFTGDLSTGDLRISNSLRCPTHYGSAVSGGDITIRGTSHADNNGDVILNNLGGRVGIGIGIDSLSALLELLQSSETDDYISTLRTYSNEIDYSLFSTGAYGDTTINQRDATGDVGTGADGEITISTTKTIDSDAIATGRAEADAVEYAITSSVAAAATSINVGAAPDGIVEGDEILIIITRDPNNTDAELYGFHTESTATSGGATTLTDTGQNWGVNALAGMELVIKSGTGIGEEETIASNTSDTITVDTGWTTNPDNTSTYAVLDLTAWATNLASINVGLYETKWVTDVTGNVITLDSGLTNAYDGTTYTVKIQRVPQYSVVSVQNGGTLQCSDYDKTTGLGGIIFFRASNQVSVSKGGTITATDTGYAGGGKLNWGGYGGDTYNGSGGQGNFEAGADGTTGQGAGGGGADGGAGTIGGSGGGGCRTAGAGGGAGYAGVGIRGTGAVATWASENGSGTKGGRGYNSSGDGTWSGGGGGGTYGDAALTHLMFGSGAGGGSTRDADKFGGNGGGILFISTEKIEVLGTMSADGGPGKDQSGSTSSDGGGGSGGSLWLKSRELILGTELVTADGGIGGPDHYAPGGGNGGVGRVKIAYTTLTGTPSPAAGSVDSSYPTTTQTDALTVDNYAGGYLMNLKAGGTSRYYVRNDGGVVSVSGALSDNAFDFTGSEATTSNIMDVTGSQLTEGSLYHGETDTLTSGDLIKLIGTNTDGTLGTLRETGSQHAINTKGLVIDIDRDDEGTFDGKVYELLNDNDCLSVMDNFGRMAISGQDFDTSKQFKARGFSVGDDGNVEITDYRTLIEGTAADGDITVSAAKVIDTEVIAGGRAVADAINYNISTMIKERSTTIDVGEAPAGIVADDEILIMTLRDPNNIDVHNYGYVTESTSTSGAASTLTDSGQDWAVDGFASNVVIITAGTGKNQTRTISSNTATVLTVSVAWTTNPDGTSVYKIVDMDGWDTNSAAIKVGQYETRIVTDVTDNIITLNYPLQYSYDGANYKVMIQRVPQYEDVVIENGGSLSVSEYSNTNGKGGVLFFRATSVSVENGGTITAAEKGYPLGTFVANVGFGGMTYNGIGGNSSQTSAATVGQGGGAGEDTSGTVGTIGGGGGGATNFGQGGGGSYGTHGTKGSGLNTGDTPIAAVGIMGGTGSTYNGSHGYGGTGGTYGTIDLKNLILGSGGASGASYDGGDGGGIIYIGTLSLTVAGTISCDGETAGGVYQDGSGGSAGSGGSIFIQAQTATLGASLVTADGGDGGASQYQQNPGVTGNGGDGRIRVDYDTLTGTTSPVVGYSEDYYDDALCVDKISAGNIINLKYDGTSKAWIDTDGDGYFAGDVGIGTPTPTYELDVAGDIGLNQYLYHNNDADTRINFTEDDVEFEVGSEVLLKLTEAGQDIVKLGDGGDVDINLNDDYLLEGSTGWLRSQTANYVRYYHLPVSSFDPGVAGATWDSADANTVGGWRLNAAGDTLEFGVDVHSDWDGASDLTVEVYFAVRLGGALPADTVDLRLQCFYNGVGELATKTQTVEVATVVGAAIQYTVFQATFTIDWNIDAGNTVQVGDKFGFIFNLETDTSEVDDIVILQGGTSFYYKTTHIGIESGDV